MTDINDMPHSVDRRPCRVGNSHVHSSKFRAAADTAWQQHFSNLANKARHHLEYRVNTGKPCRLIARFLSYYEWNQAISLLGAWVALVDMCSGLGSRMRRMRRWGRVRRGIGAAPRDHFIIMCLKKPNFPKICSIAKNIKWGPIRT